LGSERLPQTYTNITFCVGPDSDGRLFNIRTGKQLFECCFGEADYSVWAAAHGFANLSLVDFDTVIVHGTDTDLKRGGAIAVSGSRQLMAKNVYVCDKSSYFDIREAIRRCRSKKFSGLRDPVAAVMQAFGVVLGDGYCSRVRTVGGKSGFPVFSDQPTDVSYRTPYPQTELEVARGDELVFDNSTWTADVPLIFELYARILAAKQKSKVSRADFQTLEDWVDAMHAASKLSAKQPATVLPSARALHLQCLRASYQPRLFAEATCSARSVLYSCSPADAYGFHSVEIDNSGWAVPLWHDCVYPLWVHQSLGVWPNSSEA